MIVSLLGSILLFLDSSFESFSFELVEVLELAELFFGLFLDFFDVFVELSGLLFDFPFEFGEAEFVAAFGVFEESEFLEVEVFGDVLSLVLLLFGLDQLLS